MTLFLRVVAGIVLGTALLVGGLAVAFRTSPYPSVWLIRRAFDQGAQAASAALEPHVPRDVIKRLDVVYDPNDRDGRLDLFYPARFDRSDTRATTVVWVHGGGWVSGTPRQIDAYAQILASRGFVVTSVGYTIAPEAAYPRPLQQIDAALAFLRSHAQRYHIDPHRIVLAGDSAGSQIAAQIANLVTDPSYVTDVGVRPSLPRTDLKGLLLFCGAYDVSTLKLDRSFDGLLRAIMWAYSGTKRFQDVRLFRTISVQKYVTAAFPPSFISAGNADPLAPQSYEFAGRLQRLGVPTDTLFFPKTYAPALGHEYQFDLDTAAGREALDHAARFLRAVK